MKHDKPLEADNKVDHDGEMNPECTDSDHNHHITTPSKDTQPEDDSGPGLDSNLLKDLDLESGLAATAATSETETDSSSNKHNTQEAEGNPNKGDNGNPNSDDEKKKKKEPKSALRRLLTETPFLIMVVCYVIWFCLEWACKFPWRGATLCVPLNWGFHPPNTTATPPTAVGGLPRGLGPPWHGEWQRYIRAPENKSHIVPERIYRVRGNVSTSGQTNLLVPGMEFGDDVTGQGQGDGILLGMGGSLTVAFKENIGGRVCLDIDSIGMGSEKEGVVVVSLAYSESPWYAGPVPDATTDRQERDLPLRLKLKGKKKGKVCVGKDFIRGSFKYFTISVPVPWALEEGVDVVDDGDGGKKRKKKKWVDRHWLRIKSLWVISTAYPAMEDGRNYTGYFYSSSDLLNRIWYAGAWTLQLSTIDPREGSALIDYNRLVDHNRSPIGSWYSNFTISNGTSVTTDGAKRDRVVWPGDMFIAVPGIAVSTNDMLSVRNALDVLYDHQYGDGSLPYAGPPMGYHNEFSDTYHMHTLLGTYNYVLYTGDLDYLRSRWEAYLRALAVSISKVDTMGLLHVSSVADWLRPGMTGHNLEASAILYTVLEKSIALASWLSEEADNSTSIATRHLSLISSWKSTQKTIETGLARLYCPSTGLFSDNIGVRSCKGPYHVDPQDGNSWVLISRLNLSESNIPFQHPKSSKRLLDDPLPPGVPSARNISTNLRNRWTKFGAPAVEFPNVISPFAGGFELLAHCATGNITAAVELMLLEWGYLLDGPGFTNSTLAEGFRVDGHMQYPAYPSAARNSHAHGWSSGPTSVLMGEVVGIEIAKYGGLVVRFHPRLPGWLGFVRGGFGGDWGWGEVLVWRVREWLPLVDDYHEGDGYGDGEEEGVRDGFGQGGGQGQKPLVSISRLTKHRRPVGVAASEEGGDEDDVVRNSQGQRMKKTDRGGIVVKIAVSEATRAGVVSFGGLLEDLWEEEMRRSGGAVDIAGQRDDSVPLKWDIDLGLVLELARKKKNDENNNKSSKGGKKVESSVAFWLRWATREGIDVHQGDDDDDELHAKGQLRYHVTANGKRYKSWPEVNLLTGLEERQLQGDGDGDGFREPIEAPYPRTGDEADKVMLRFDEDFVPLEMDTTRPAGVVDWDVMEENFRTPVYEGWSADRLRREAEAEAKGGDVEKGGGEGGGVQDILEGEMGRGVVGMDGGWWEYLDE